jgi:hypothetical protein
MTRDFGLDFPMLDLLELAAAALAPIFRYGHRMLVI